MDQIYTGSIACAAPRTSTESEQSELELFEGWPCLRPASGGSLRARLPMQAPHAGYSLPFKDAAVEARLDPNSKLCRNPLLPRLALGAKVSQIGTTIGVPHPALIQSRDIRKSL